MAKTTFAHMVFKRIIGLYDWIKKSARERIFNKTTKTLRPTLAGCIVQVQIGFDRWHQQFQRLAIYFIKNYHCCVGRSFALVRRCLHEQIYKLHQKQCLSNFDSLTSTNACTLIAIHNNRQHWKGIGNQTRLKICKIDSLNRPEQTSACYVHHKDQSCHK